MVLPLFYILYRPGYPSRACDEIELSCSNHSDFTLKIYHFSIIFLLIQKLEVGNAVCTG